MSDVSTTRLSSKGQVVIPEEIRKRLDLKAGTRFVVVGEDDVIILKSVQTPPISELDTLVAAARDQAQRAGLTQIDIEKAVKKARKR